MDSARALGVQPGRAFCGAASGDVAAVKAYYRFIGLPDDDQAITMQAMLAPHRQRTLQRMMAQPLVLCVQDGTELNYTNLAQCQGLGALGTNQTGARSMGLHLHSTLALTAQGLPLGVLDANCQAPTTGAPARTSRSRRRRPSIGSRGCANANRPQHRCPPPGWSA